MKNLTLSAIACGILVFAACSKTEEKPSTNTNTTKSKKDLVVDGKWKWTDLAFVMNIGGKDSLINAWSEVDQCDRDDIMSFTSDGKGTIDEGSTKCDPSDPQIENITWEMLDNETKVKVTTPDETSVLTIVELTATKAVYKQRMFTGSDSITVQQTFTNVK
jgi:hypothetical protein